MQSGVQERISGAPAVPFKPTLCSESSNSGSSKLTVHSNQSCVDYKYFDPPLVRAFKSVKNGARHPCSCWDICREFADWTLHKKPFIAIDSTIITPISLNYVRILYSLHVVCMVIHRGFAIMGVWGRNPLKICRRGYTLGKFSFVAVWVFWNHWYMVKSETVSYKLTWLTTDPMIFYNRSTPIILHRPLWFGLKLKYSWNWQLHFAVNLEHVLTCKSWIDIGSVYVRSVPS